MEVKCACRSSQPANGQRAGTLYNYLTLTFTTVISFTSLRMYAKCWLIIKDDDKLTFEVIGKASNDNSFSNRTHGMQKDGMNVTSVVLPVTNKNSTKQGITFINYTLEEGLYERLLKEHNAIIMRNAGEW